MNKKIFILKWINRNQTILIVYKKRLKLYVLKIKAFPVH